MLPLLAAFLAAACVTTHGRPANTFSPFGTYPALGAGPVYPLADVQHGSLYFAPRRKWSFQKVLWMVGPRHPGGVTVTLRGARFANVAGNGALLSTSSSIRIPAGRGWRGRPSEVVVRGPGCIRAVPSVGAPVTIRTVT